MHGSRGTMIVVHCIDACYAKSKINLRYLGGGGEGGGGHVRGLFSPAVLRA